ncbi:MAG: hypothetical protein EOM00_05070 [Clostridia bacterium]|nr:hypothetical protein [Clostridia bacterium]
MKKHTMRLVGLLLAVIMLFTVVGCSNENADLESSANNNSVQNDTLSDSENNETQDENSGARVITDALGREVEIPAEVKTIVPLGNTPRMISYLGIADMVVGIEECEIATSPIQAYAYPHVDKWSNLPNCGTNSMGETAYYPEQIMIAAPDVILSTDTADVADNLQTQTGIPVVCVAQGTLFGDDYDQSLRILADVCGVNDRAESLIKFIDDSLADLAARAATVSDESKPTVLGAGATFKGSHSIDGVYTNYSVFEVLAANDVAEEIAGQGGSSGVMVDREQILAWDPEIIFFDSGSMGLINSDYAENPGYFEQLQAVQNGNLYQWPNSTWHWSNVEIPLVSAYYVGTLLYPDAFADVDFEAKASEIFEMFLGEPDYLSVLEAAGAGYGKVTLGE